MSEVLQDPKMIGSVKLLEDKVLRVEIPLTVPEGREIEGRVSAYGLLQWANTVVTRFYDIQERNLAIKNAQAADGKAKLGVIKPDFNRIPPVKG